MEIRFTQRELDVMSVLWDRGPSTVADVRASHERSIGPNRPNPSARTRPFTPRVYSSVADQRYRAGAWQ